MGSKLFETIIGIRNSFQNFLKPFLAIINTFQNFLKPLSESKTHFKTF